MCGEKKDLGLLLDGAVAVMYFRSLSKDHPEALDWQHLPLECTPVAELFFVKARAVMY